MKKTFAEKLKTKLNEWFNEPVGDVGIVPDHPDNELKRPNNAFKAESVATKATRGRGDKREVPHTVTELHLRGAAGHRPARGPQAAHKAVMPHKGSHPRYPK